MTKRKETIRRQHAPSNVAWTLRFNVPLAPPKPTDPGPDAPEGGFVLLI